jgi:hypothetical protein
MVIGDLTLWEKTGGRSGTYRRDDGPASGAVSDDTTNVASPVKNVVES